MAQKFLWNGGSIAKEYKADGSVRADYQLGAGTKIDGKWQFYLSDIQGSTLGVADDTGKVIATWAYSDYGVTTQTSGDKNLYQPFLYTHSELDAETGLYHNKARHYAPKYGKFLARDPIANNNLYSYCNGDPINFIDPRGLAPVGTVSGTGSGTSGAWETAAELGEDIVELGPEVEEIAEFSIAGPLGILFGIGTAAWTYHLIHSNNGDAPGYSKPCYVNLASPQRTIHILYGDATGGGHMYPGLPGKSVFPEGWSPEQIMEHLSDIVTDPSLPWISQTGSGGLYTKSGKPATFVVYGNREGVDIKVIIRPAGEGIISGYPASPP